MPELKVPKIGRTKIKVTPPAKIPSPEYMAGQAYRGMQQIGGVLAKVGNAFMVEILQARELSQIAQGEKDIEDAYFETIRGIESGQVDPADAQKVFDKYNDFVNTGIIPKIPGRGARATVQNRYNTRVSRYQHNLFNAAFQKEWINQRTNLAVLIEKKKTDPYIPILTEEGPTIENYVKAVQERISELETLVINGGNTFIGGKPVLSAAEVQLHLDRIHKEVPMEFAAELAFPMGEEVGGEWLRKNRKKLGLSFKDYDAVSDLLEDRWRQQRAVLKRDQEKQKQAILSQWVIDAETNEFVQMAQDLDLSLLPDVDKKRLENSYNIGLERRVRASITGKDLSANQFVYQELLDLVPSVKSGDMEIEKAMAAIDLAYITGDLGTGKESKTKHSFLKKAFKTEEESGIIAAKKRLIDHAKHQIITTGVDETKFERLMGAYVNAGVMTAEQFEVKSKKEWARFHMFQRAIEESPTIKAASPDELEAIGLKILAPYLDKSYEAEIDAEVYGNYKRMWGITPEEEERQDYDFLSAYRDGVVPTRFAELSNEEQKFLENKFKGTYEFKQDDMVWPDAYKISGDTKLSQVKDPTIGLVSPKEQLQILRMAGGPKVNQQIDFYLNAGMSIENTVKAIKFYIPTTVSQEGIKGGKVRRSRITGKRERWDGANWQPIK